MESSKLRRDWSKRTAIITGIWTLFGLVFASQTYLAYGRMEHPIGWHEALFLELSYAYLWAALTPFILMLAARFRLDRQHWARNIVIHALAGTLIGFTMRAVHDLIFFLYFAPPGRTLSFVRLLQNAYSLFDYGLLTYWVILVISNALDYYRRYQEGELKASRLETQLAQAQLQALKMQLNPHFLFNTLNSISSLLHRNVEAADTMIARLGDFLRLTLENSGAQEVTLRQELEFLKHYLAIEATRYQDRLIVDIDVEQDTLDAFLPNLILQPIVENAIKHGIAPRSDLGRIEISVKKLGDDLRILVTDNGPGLNGHAGSIIREGYGLANTQARLYQVYGDAHRLDLTNGPKGGLVVTLEVPFRNEANGKKPA
jgi:sensor histidine kinase YesM